MCFTVCWATVPLLAQEDGPNDPYYSSKGSWGQDYDDQWGLKRVGFTTPGGGTSAWDKAAGTRAPVVVVAVIDTGLDYFHPDLKKENIWRNPKEEPNAIDDDKNGYIDDLIGWNFIDRNNNPWDRAGHGTHTAGVIAAATGNGEGIAGMNPAVKIMPLKVLNFLGRGRSSGIAEAIFYAVENGARVINLSLGGEYITKIEKKAVAFADKHGVIVVVASGNTASNTSDYGFARLGSVITVAATDFDDKRAKFSNWGKDVKIAAPGVDILSLRARQTDFQLIARVKGYKPGDGFVSPENRYYRASGTSFAAPFVSGVASLILAKNPELTAEQVTRMILMSADDIEVPGVDQYTGYGLLDARAALMSDPDYYLIARITKVQPIQEQGRVYLEVAGNLEGSDFSHATIDLGFGEKPEKWEGMIKVSQPVKKEGRVGLVPAAAFKKPGQWTVRLTARDKKGKVRESRASVSIE